MLSFLLVWCGSATLPILAFAKREGKLTLSDLMGLAVLGPFGLILTIFTCGDVKLWERK